MGLFYNNAQWLVAAIVMFIIASYCYITGDPLHLFAAGRLEWVKPQDIAGAYFLCSIVGFIIWRFKK